MEFAEKIKKERKDKGWSQELAEKLALYTAKREGRNQVQVYNGEKGELIKAQ